MISTLILTFPSQASHRADEWNSSEPFSVLHTRGLGLVMLSHLARLPHCTELISPLRQSSGVYLHMVIVRSNFSEMYLEVHVI